MTDLLHEGRNFVIVKVDNKRSASAVPTQIFDWWNYGGITRDVMLLSVAPTYIENYSLSLKKKEERGKRREIVFSANLNCKEAGREITLSIPELKLKQRLVTDANGGGRANSAEDARTLLTWAKELGCNFVRLAHYPHNEYMVREAERMGLMVWSEIPCYWTIDWKNEATYQNARRQLTDIQDYYNMKGLVSDKGERKKAWYVLHEWYEGK